MPRAIPENDRTILRRLAERKLEIAHDPINEERRQAWYNLDSGNDHRVMLLAEYQEIKDDNAPGGDLNIQCSDPKARQLERVLRHEIYTFEVIKDDHVVEPLINCNWRINAGDFGVTVEPHYSNANVIMGARTWDNPIKNLDADFHKLKPRNFSVDRERTYADMEILSTIFGGILDVRLHSKLQWTYGMTWMLVELIGLENLMLYMFDNPDGLHRIMGFLRDDHIRFAKWAESEGILTLNNKNDYIGSGSVGYSEALPKTEQIDHVRTDDLWALLESQETVGVGPQQFEEFIFPYQKDIAGIFGRIYYGCCEPVHSRWDILKTLPNLARISVSPWADETVMADAVGMDYVYSRKPNPTLISTEIFDEQAIRNDLQKTLSLTKGQRVEIIMKDVHTLNNEPDRLCRWIQLAREEIERSG